MAGGVRGGVGAKGGGKGPKGGGGKGGKGKSGQGCLPDQVTLCFTESDLTVLKTAFNGAVKSQGLNDGCVAGFMRVCLDRPVAQMLISTLVLGLRTSGSKKKKKGKGKTI